MSRLIYPTEFLLQVRLFNKMNAKHTLDGAASILNIYLAENSIVLADDAAAVTAAGIAHDDAEQLGKDSEKLYKEADKLFKPAFAQHRKCVQFLKSFYKNNIGKLGDWGVTVNGKKIVYPKTVEEKITAIVALIDKHASFPAGTSPLEGFLTNNTDIDLTVNKANCTSALTHRQDAAQMAIDKETKYGERNALIDPVNTHSQGIGGFLKDNFAANPNKAGDWGYTIDNSPQGSIVRNGLVNIGSSKVLTNLVNEGVLINESEFDLELFKGKTASGTAIVLKPGKPFVITTGFGTVTLHNPNDEKKAAYQGVFHK
ncbi:MAG: hypothetical protein ACHQNT_00335 [Bacteroidia bacterium]